jgi:hypothetical protein
MEDISEGDLIELVLKALGTRNKTFKEKLLNVIVHPSTLLHAELGESVLNKDKSR